MSGLQEGNLCKALLNKAVVSQFQDLVHAGGLILLFIIDTCDCSLRVSQFRCYIYPNSVTTLRLARFDGRIEFQGPFLKI